MTQWHKKQSVQKYTHEDKFMESFGFVADLSMFESDALALKQNRKVYYTVCNIVMLLYTCNLQTTKYNINYHTNYQRFYF